MLDIEKIKRDLNSSTDQLIEVLTNFPTDYFNKKPSADTWSAGDVAEHLWLVETAVNQKVMQGQTLPTGRGADEKIEKVRTTFLDFEKKFSAKLTQPTDVAKDKNNIIAKIKVCRQQLINFIDTHDLGQECLGFNHSLFGLMTKVEWVYYNIYHTERHLQQIHRIKVELTKSIAHKGRNTSLF